MAWTFFYPLSDFAAVFLFALGTYLILHFGFQWPAAVLTGMAWAGAAIVRPSYLITLIPLLLWAAHYYVRENRLSMYPALIRLAAKLAGISIIFAPQVNINLTHFGVLSPLPQTQLYYGENLFIKQLGWGLVMQKYETNIGSNYPTAGVIFLDLQGENILLKSGFKSNAYTESKQIIPDRSLTFAEYAGLIFKYPLDFMSIYMRHLFNGLDIVYNTVYVEDIYNSSILLRLTNYSLWFLVSFYISRRVVKLGTSQLFIPVIFALPSMVSIPTAMEVRFMLPIHLMAYTLVAFQILPAFVAMSFDQKKEYFLKNWIGYFIFIVFCFILSSNTYMSLIDGVYLLSGK